MNPGSERGDLPSPDDNGGGPFVDRLSSGGGAGRGSSGPGSDRSNADDDHGCEPVTGGGDGGRTQDEFGFVFWRDPRGPKGAPTGGRYRNSGTGFDDLYKPKPKDDYGINGPSARSWNNAESVDAWLQVNLQKHLQRCPPSQHSLPWAYRLTHSPHPRMYLAQALRWHLT